MFLLVHDLFQNRLCSSPTELEWLFANFVMDDSIESPVRPVSGLPDFVEAEESSIGYTRRPA